MAAYREAKFRKGVTSRHFSCRLLVFTYGDEQDLMGHNNEPCMILPNPSPPSLFIGMPRL